MDQRVNTMMNLPARVAVALFDLQRIEPEAGISGGYLRDIANGKPPKDIDVFCPLLTETKRTSLSKVFPGAKQEPYSAWLDYATGEVEAVWDLGLVDGLPFQLIELKVGLSPVERFKFNDFAICQLWHDGFSMQASKAALQDIAYNTFTLTQCENQKEFDRSMRRWERLKAKYPDHSLVIPEEFRKYQ